MEKAAIKEIMYGGISELMQNSRFYYRSSVGNSYSYWTDEGKKTLDDFMKEITQYIYEAEQAELDNRARDLVLKELKS